MAKGEMVQFPEDVGEGRWMTYSELARIRGIGRESAVKLVQRERWRKLAGNDRDRTVRVLVPVEWLKPARQELQGTFPEGVGEPVPEGIPEVSPQISALQTAMEAMRGENSTLREQQERERARADAMQRERDEANKRADIAVVLADRTLAQLGEATGRAERAEALAGQAERDWAAERARADRAELAQDRLEGELEAAQIAKAEAEAAAEELRQADTARRGQGRWARLMTAWRGER